MFHARIAAAIDAARTLAGMDELSRSIWQAHGSGTIGDDEAQTLAEALHGRRLAIRGLLTPVGILIGRICSFFLPKRLQRSPDRVESTSRRRHLAASGPMPPALAVRFTTGQLVVLRIVGDEFAQKGVCSLCIDAIAARAGVTARWAQKAIRLAEGDGLINVQERRHQGRKNDPSLVRIISREWQAWLKRGSRQMRNSFASHGPEPHRVNSSSTHGYQGSNPAPQRPAEPSKWLPAGSGRPQPKSASSNSRGR